MKHSHDLICSLCERKKRDLHPELQDWFDRMKAQFHDAHLSHTFRDKLEQDRLVEEKKSLLRWPRSLHNHTINGKPHARAFDLFRLTENNQAEFNIKYFNLVYDFFLYSKAPIVWGGMWEHFKDYPHFQLKIGIPDRPESTKQV